MAARAEQGTQEKGNKIAKFYEKKLW